jgi:hypothetical protein
MSKVIKLMTDYDCFPIWEIFDDSVENISPDSLDISEQLRKDLDIWSNVYDQTINIDDPKHSGFSSPDLEKTLRWRENVYGAS